MAEACKKPVVIAVIDTGFGIGWDGEEAAHLCKFGHKNFSSNEDATNKFGTIDAVPVDLHGHGTHIAGTIDRYAGIKSKNYCIVVLKYYDPRTQAGENLIHTVDAINYARAIHADFINYSGGGLESSASEKEAVKTYIDGGGTFVAAAGNESSDLEKRHYYPAEEDDRVIVVGNGVDEDHRLPSSNYGDRVDFWEDGKNVKTYNNFMTGTSQAAAIETGKLVAQKIKTCK